MSDSIWVLEHDRDTICGNCIYYKPDLCTKLSFPLPPNHDPCVDFTAKEPQSTGYSFDSLRNGPPEKKSKEKKSKNKSGKEPIQSIVYTCGACEFFNDNFCSKQNFPVEENQIKCSRFSSRVIKELNQQSAVVKLEETQIESQPQEIISDEPICQNCAFFDYNFCSKRTFPVDPDTMKCSKFKGKGSKVGKQKKDKVTAPKNVKDKPFKGSPGLIEPICMNCQYFRENFCGRISSPVRPDRIICEKFKSAIKGKLKSVPKKYDDYTVSEQELANLDAKFESVMTSYVEEKGEDHDTIDGLIVSKYKLIEESHSRYKCGNCSFYDSDMCNKFSFPVDFNQFKCNSFTDKDLPKKDSSQISISDIMNKLDRIKATYGEDIFKKPSND